MTKKPSADIATVFREGLSGPYPNPYLTVDELLELSEMCFQHNRIVHTAEAFAVTADVDQACIEFSLLNDPPEGWADTWPERARRSRDEIVGLAAKVRAQQRNIMFEVWLDWE